MTAPAIPTDDQSGPWRGEGRVVVTATTPVGLPG